MNLKYIQRRSVVLILLMSGTIFTFACEKDFPCDNTNQITTSQKPVITPTITPFPDIPNMPTLGVDEKTDKKFHEELYQRKLKILFVIRELTNLNKSYVSKFPPDDELEKRKKKVFSLVDSLNENTTDTIKALDSTDDLITLAEMCGIMNFREGLGVSQITSSYNIAFFYSVKVVAIKHKNDPMIMNELKELKRYKPDGHPFADFLLALNGQDPKDLYREESDEDYEPLYKKFFGEGNK